MYGMLCVFAYVDASFWSTSLRGRSILFPTTAGREGGERRGGREGGRREEMREEGKVGGDR